MKPIKTMRTPDYYRLPDRLFDELLQARSALYLSLERALDKAEYNDKALLDAFAAHDIALHRLMVDTDIKRKRSTMLGLLGWREGALK